MRIPVPKNTIAVIVFALFLRQERHGQAGHTHLHRQATNPKTGPQAPLPQYVTKSTWGTHGGSSGVPPAKHRRRGQNVDEAEAGEGSTSEATATGYASAEGGLPVTSSCRVTRSTWETHCSTSGVPLGQRRTSRAVLPLRRPQRLLISARPTQQTSENPGVYSTRNNEEAKQLICKGAGSGFASAANLPFGCYQTLGDLTLKFDGQGQPNEKGAESKPFEGHTLPLVVADIV